MSEIYDIAIIPLITGLVQLFKLAGIRAKYAPFIAVILGVLFGVFFVGNNVKDGILIGLVLGLSASGLYSGSKNMLEKEKDNHE